jgi:ATP-dependent Clp protease adaptor protein ClpS
MFKNIKTYNQTTVDLPDIKTETTDVTGISTGCRVILFNDNIHTFEEVINQLMKAINCSAEKGLQIAMEVHNKGKARVYEGELKECLRVSGILEEIALHTQIEM